MNLLDELKQTIQKLGNGCGDITPETDLKELGLDSLDLVELIMGLEEKYNITFETADLFELKTVGDVMNAIEQKR